MAKNINLKDLERKIFRSTFEDGLWDMFMGCIFSQFAIGPLLPLGDFWSSFVFLPVYLVVFIFVFLGKKYLVLPRAGTVKFGKQRKTKLLKILFVSNILFFVGAITGIMFSKLGSEINKWLFPAGFSLVMLFGFSMAAYLLIVPRFYIYGALTGVAIPLGEILYRYHGASDHGFPIVFGICSSVMVITGIVLFIRFMQKYPKAVVLTDLKGDVNDKK